MEIKDTFEDLVDAINDTERSEGHPLNFRYDLPGESSYLSVTVLDDDATLVEYDNGSPVGFDGALLSDAGDLQRFLANVKGIING